MGAEGGAGRGNNEPSSDDSNKAIKIPFSSGSSVSRLIILFSIGLRSETHQTTRKSKTRSEIQFLRLLPPTSPAQRSAKMATTATKTIASKRKSIPGDKVPASPKKGQSSSPSPSPRFPLTARGAGLMRSAQEGRRRR